MDFYAADFETIEDENGARVWYWGLCNIETPEKISKGLDIESFINQINNKDKIVYFHNLKFDGGYLIDYLFRVGYEHKRVKAAELNCGEFTTLISEMGQWYTISVRLYPNERGYDSLIEFRDSQKIIPLSIEDIPKAFHLAEEKGKIDYKQYRPVGYQPTKEEEDYLNHDVIIMAKALSIVRAGGAKKLTTGSCALADYKKRIGKKYKKLFPKLDPAIDKDIRQSYKGGWTYLNPRFKNMQVTDGKVYDVNSMYPWAMKYCLLPIGNPVYFKGKYTDNANYPLYVQQLICEFHLKKGHYPSIQIKKSFMYQDNEYIEHSVEPTLLTLTNIDLELLYFNYDVEVYEWLGGYMFHGETGLFAEYVDYWFGEKTKAKKEHNKGLEYISKLYLNGLYGKFGSRLSGKSKVPYYDITEQKVRYALSEEENRKGGYLPVATFITAYCRDKINRGAYACGDRFIYADTDSLHILGLEAPEELEIDEYRLGAFKEEEVFIRAKFIRQKTYMEIFTGYSGEEKINLKCCGMPKKMKACVTEDMFYAGAVYDAAVNSSIAPKLMPKTIRGGVVLKETTFQIKD